MPWHDVRLTTSSKSAFREDVEQGVAVVEPLALRRKAARFFGHDARDDRLQAWPGERRLAGEHLIDNRCHRIQIAARVHHALAHRLLRAHVLRRTKREPGLREPLTTSLLHGERNAEIGDERTAVLQQDVFRFDVAMDDALSVRVLERAGHFTRDTHRIIHRQLAVTLEALSQRLAGDQWHDVLQQPIGHAAVEQRQDVGMLQLGGGLDLTEKPLNDERRAEVRMQHLDGGGAGDAAIICLYLYLTLSREVEMSAAVVGGIDGCRAGWVLARTTVHTAVVTTRIYGNFVDLLDANPDLTVLAIDIPIGLSDGPRRTDRAARALLGPRASSVFPAPARATLDAVSYQEASDRSFAVQGKRLSKQTFWILPKIREVDHALRTRACAAERVREVHPELCFCVLNNDQPMTHPKRTSLGFSERLNLVDAHFPGAFDLARRTHARKVAADDDLLDALAALWTAVRLQAERARAVPEGDIEFDSVGLPMAIWV